MFTNVNPSNLLNCEVRKRGRRFLGDISRSICSNHVFSVENTAGSLSFVRRPFLRLWQRPKAMLYGTWSASPTGIFSIDPCVGSGLHVARNNVVKEGASRRRLAAEITAKSMSRRERWVVVVSRLRLPKLPWTVRRATRSGAGLCRIHRRSRDAAGTVPRRRDASTTHRPVIEEPLSRKRQTCRLETFSGCRCNPGSSPRRRRAISCHPRRSRVFPPCGGRAAPP